MKRLKSFMAVGTALALSATLSACGGGSTGGAGEKIAIGIKFDQPGTSLKVGSEYKGFDADVARFVAKEFGFEADQIEFKEAVSAQRETMLSSDQVKFVIGTYSITPARAEKVTFAGPYFIAGQDILVRADDTSITGPESLDGKKLCSVTGSTSAQKIKDTYATAVDLTEMDSYSKCVQSLAGGQIDAVTTDNAILAGYAAQSQYQGKVKLVGKPFTEEQYGVGLKKGDLETCQKVNTALEKMVSSGEWQKAVDANFTTGGFQIDASINPPKPAECK